MADSPPSSTEQGQRFRVEVGGLGAFECAAGENALAAMERARLALVPVGCRGGGCGVCRVRVISGRYLTRPMSTTRVTPAERVTGHALCCRLLPLGDLLIEPVTPLTYRARRGGGPPHPRMGL